MTKAKITKKDGYTCAPNGYKLETFAFGEEVEGKVAEWALADKAAKAVFPKKTKNAGKAPENKSEA